MPTIHQRIKRRREELRMSRADLGNKVGVSQQAVYGWEENDAQPSYHRLKLIADALKTTVEWLSAGIDVNVPLAAKYCLIPRLGSRREGDGLVDYHNEVGDLKDDENTFAYRRDLLEQLGVEAQWCRVFVSTDDSMALGQQLLIDLKQSQLEDGKVFLLDTPAGLKVRRLYMQIDGMVRVRADRPDVPEQLVSRDAVKVIGRVVAFQGVL
jgi:transcriptional regulator with XRE-family HTH domain